MGEFRGGLGSRIPNPNKTTKELRVPELLQSGFGFAKIQNMDRSRRLGALYEGRSTNRQEKREFSNIIRVERVKILQPGNRGNPTKCIVYNLQVSEHPSYFAEGFLVHNCHLYKNSKAHRTKAVKMIGKGLDHVIALSGTPILNRPIEVRKAIKLIDPTLVPNDWYFVMRYCNARHDGFGWDMSGSSNTEELHQILSTSIMIRRLKTDVLSDLPDKIRSFIPIELTNRDRYTEAERNFIKFIKETKGEEAARKAKAAEHLVKVEALKQVAVQGKLKTAITWIQDFLEIERKLVVFSMHTDVIERLLEEFPGIAVRYDGKMSGIEKDRAIGQFQTDPSIRLFIGNIKAAGVGINLTASNSVAFLELPWTPADLDQCEDRCHRIGQRDVVRVYYLLAEGTIEERIARMIDGKRKVLDAIMDGKVTESESLLTELIKSYLDENQKN